ncbi:TetR/AcrR family transcriptional regulator [Paenibacillus harenae]|uniref:TetR/AcrR family transcriptional regulator n=1 Tax=Paenibacillus harenae TaxID=306543 RepID=UPI0004168C20|nr:TetR/AcrR family transcriptional regulator [Paenibacillus harenae]
MTPRTKEQNDEIRAARIRQILAAAADVYLAKGVMLEIRDVAARAGLGYGTVYHYYRNKHELLHDMLWHAFEQARAATDAAFDQDGAPLGRLRRGLKHLLRLWLDQPSVYILYKMVAENFHHMPSDRFPGLYDRFRQELYQPVAALLREGGGLPYPEKRANMVIGSLIGCAGLYIHHRHMEIDIDEAVDVWFAGTVGIDHEDRKEI